MIEIQQDSDDVRCLIDGLLHFHFKRKYYRGMSAYHENIYTVEILLQDQNLILEYDKRILWENILKALNDVL